MISPLRKADAARTQQVAKPILRSRKATFESNQRLLESNNNRLKRLLELSERSEPISRQAAECSDERCPD